MLHIKWPLHVWQQLFFNIRAGDVSTPAYFQLTALMQFSNCTQLPTSLMEKHRLSWSLRTSHLVWRLWSPFHTDISLQKVLVRTYCILPVRPCRRWAHPHISCPGRFGEPELGQEVAPCNISSESSRTAITTCLGNPGSLAKPWGRCEMKVVRRTSERFECGLGISQTTKAVW